MRNHLSKLNQHGIAPIILIIILTVIVAGIAGAVYKSTKEIRVRTDKTSEVVESKPSSSPKSQDLAADKIGKLADKPVAIKSDNSNEASPKFSITPPAGWEKLPPNGNYPVEFKSPSEDKITEGDAYFLIKPTISVFVSKEQYQNLDEALASRKFDSTYTVNQKSKSQINGQEAYVIESVKDVRDLAKNLMETQLKEELANAKKQGIQASTEQVQKDMNKVLTQAKIKILSYIFYKDGYFINVSGKTLEPFWSSRETQLKQSMDTFKFE